MKENLQKSLLTKPYPSQINGIKHFLKYGNVGIRHSTGKGKTYFAICLGAYALSKHLVDVVYIFYTKSAYDAFHSDFTSMTRLNPVWIQASKDWKGNANFYCIPVNRINKVYSQIRDSNSKALALFDEIQVLKNPKSTLRQTYDTLRDKFEYVVGLTATPMANHIDDLYWITQYIKPWYFGNFWSFKRKYCILQKRKTYRGGKLRTFHEVTGYKNLDHLMLKAQELWHTALESMPIEYNYDYKAELTEEEDKLYLEVAKGMVDGEYKDFVVRLPGLQRIVDLSETKLNLATSLIQRLVDENKGVIVFFSIKAAMEELRQRIKAETMVIDGSKTTKQRVKVRENFDKGKVIFMTWAGSKSLNLQAGNQVVFYNTPFEIELFAQTIGRVARPSVSEYDKVEVHFLIVKNSIDEYRVALMKANADLIQLVFGEGDPNLPQMLSGVKRSMLIKMRKDLLWRMKK